MRNKALRQGARNLQQLLVLHTLKQVDNLLEAAATRKLDRCARAFATARIRLPMERCVVFLDEHLGQLVPTVKRRLVNRGVLELRAVGRSDVGAGADESFRHVDQIALACDVVELHVELARYIRTRLWTFGGEHCK